MDLSPQESANYPLMLGGVGGGWGGRDPEVKATQTAGSRRGRRRLFLISVVKVPCSGRFCGCLDVKCQPVVRRAASVPG